MQSRKPANLAIDLARSILLHPKIFTQPTVLSPNKPRQNFKVAAVDNFHSRLQTSHLFSFL